MSPAAKAKSARSARSPRTGRAKAAAKPQEETPAAENGEVKEDEAAKESAREAARREKEEKEAAARAAAIEDGTLIVTDDFEFTASDKLTASAETLHKILGAYQESEVPLVFNEVATAHGAKYPEDLVIAMYGLEELGFVNKYNAKATGSDGAGRSRVAFLWVADEEEGE